jgi:hypothetical protein
MRHISALINVRATTIQMEAQMLDDAERVTARLIKATAQSEINAISADKTITRRERDRLRAKAILQARSEMRDLKAASDARRQAGSAAAYRKAFGIDPARAAEDRALRAQLAKDAPSAGEAQRMFNEASARGDGLMCRALAEYAFSQRYTPGGHFIAVLQAYGDAFPANDAAVRGVLEFSEEPSKVEKFADKMATDILVPADMPPNLETLAASAGDVPASSAPRAMGANWGAGESSGASPAA